MTNCEAGLFSSPATGVFTAAVKKTSGQAPQANAEFGYDGIIITALAMDESHSTKGATFNAAIQKVTAQGGTPVYSYSQGLAALKAGKKITYVGQAGRSTTTPITTSTARSDGGLEGVEAGPGEAADEPFVDVGEPGVGEVVAQVVEVGPNAVGADRLPDGVGVGQSLVPSGDPQPVQDPPVARIGGEAVSVTFGAKDADLASKAAVPGGRAGRAGRQGSQGSGAGQVGADVVVAQCPVGVHGDLGAEQVGGGALELEHVEQVAVVGDVAAEPPGGGERRRPGPR